MACYVDNKVLSFYAIFVLQISLFFQESVFHYELFDENKNYEYALRCTPVFGVSYPNGDLESTLGNWISLLLERFEKNILHSIPLCFECILVFIIGNIW